MRSRRSPSPPKNWRNRFRDCAGASSGSATSPTLVISRSGPTPHSSKLAMLGEVRLPIQPRFLKRCLSRQHFAGVAVAHHILPYVIVGWLKNTVEVEVTNFVFFLL